MFAVHLEDLALAIYLVGAIDDDGILRRSLEDIVDDLAFSQGVFTEIPLLEKMLGIIQELDPPGVGGRDLRECLMLQLERKNGTSKVELALTILDNYFDAFVKRHYQKLMDRQVTRI